MTDDYIPLGDQLTEYNGVMMAIKDIPEPAIRRLLGYGHRTCGRSVIAVDGRTWETIPDVCTYGDMNWEWVTVDGGEPKSWPVAGIQYLVCPKCGLDGT